MSYQYTKSLQNDFGGEITPWKLHEQIENNGFIEMFIGLTVNGDDVILYFNNEIMSNDMITLNAIINEHTPIQQPTIGKNIILIPFINNDYKNNNFKKIINFTFRGTNAYGNLTNIKVFSFSSKPENYDLKLYDVTNNKIICSATFNNIIEQNNDMGAISNLPIESATLELQICTYSNRVHVDSLELYFN